MMNVGELRKQLENYEDDVEICVDAGDQMLEVMSAYEDEARPGFVGLFLSTGAELPPL